MSKLSAIYVGYDSREVAAFAVARHSITRRLTQRIPIRGLLLSNLQDAGLYTRPMEYRKSAADLPIMWDVISDAPMSTEFACSRFLVPTLGGGGWVLFMDCDMLVRTNLARLTDGLDDSKAVYCVKHNYAPASTIKMDGQTQVNYNRKLWSSFCLFNASHESNRALTPQYVNSIPGRDLHAFKWLADDEIGELGQEWNWIPGHSPQSIDPKVVHFSEGGPWFHNYSDVPFANEWHDELRSWAV